MTRQRVGEKAKQRFREAVRDITNNLSRVVVVYGPPETSECFNCYFDKLTGRSTGRCRWDQTQAAEKQLEWQALGNTDIKYKYFTQGRCPVCKGQGYLITPVMDFINCIVDWNPIDGDKLIQTSAGNEGSSLVSLKTEPKHLDTFKNAVTVIVDGLECRLARTPIARGLGAPHILNIMLFTTTKLKPDSGETIKDYT